MTGELGRKMTIGDGQATKNSIFYRYKRSAKIRNLSWELDRDEFFDLTSRNCYYCGSHPITVHKVSKSFNGDFICNGIDRLDSKLGYVRGNCVPCCKHCNYAKRSLSYDEFIELVRRIYNNLCL